MLWPGPNVELLTPSGYHPFGKRYRVLPQVHFEHDVFVVSGLHKDLSVVADV